MVTVIIFCQFPYYNSGIIVAMCSVICHLDRQGWTQSGLEMTEEELNLANILFASKHSKKKVLKVNSNTLVKSAPYILQESLMP